MLLRVPHYYGDFKCIASECKDNCCIGGWEIDIDSETAQYYLSLRGEFGDMLRASISQGDEYCFKLNNGRCPFLDNNNLCEIYRQLGEERMGVVCAQFPRFTEYFGGVKERGIGLACEEAARIILSDRQPFLFEETVTDEEIIEDSEYDEQLAKALFIYRGKLIELVETEKFTVNEKLSFMLETAYELQVLINDNDYALLMDFVEKFDFEAYKGFDEYLADNRIISNGRIIKDGGFDAREGIFRVVSTYLELEAINDNWSDIINEELDRLEAFSKDNGGEAAVFSGGDSGSAKSFYNYDSVCHEFSEYTKDCTYQYNNIIKYYIFRYVLKAAYDHSLYEKMQLITANYLVIRQMELTRWIKNGKRLDFDDRMEIIHIFSREVEYSEDNLWTLAEEFLFDDIFQKDNLIFLLKSVDK